jgi:oligopeptide transport system substrate-binding protein
LIREGLPAAQKPLLKPGFFEGLTTLNAKGIPVPAVAARWEISSDGLTYIFFLRKNAK